MKEATLETSLVPKVRNMGTGRLRGALVEKEGM